MDLDDIFENDQKRKHQNYDRNYRHEDDYRHENEYNSSHSQEKREDIKQLLLEKLRNNPDLKKILIFGSIVLFIIVLGLIILLLPLILKLFGFVTENGIEGFLNTIWKGTK